MPSSSLLLLLSFCVLDCLLTRAMPCLILSPHYGRQASANNVTSCHYCRAAEVLAALFAARRWRCGSLCSVVHHEVTICTLISSCLEVLTTAAGRWGGEKIKMMGKELRLLTNPDPSRREARQYKSHRDLAKKPDAALTSNNKDIMVIVAAIACLEGYKGFPLHGDLSSEQTSCCDS